MSISPVSQSALSERLTLLEDLATKLEENVEKRVNSAKEKNVKNDVENTRIYCGLTPNQAARFANVKNVLENARFRLVMAQNRVNFTEEPMTEKEIEDLTAKADEIEGSLMKLPGAALEKVQLLVGPEFPIY